MKILLFGASGRLGSAIMRVLPHHTYLAPRAKDVDITNHDTVKKYIATHPVDFIINCAAYNDVKGAEAQSDIANVMNGEAPGYIAQAAAAHTTPFIHFSSDYVFDGTATSPYTETSVPNPINAYARSKFLGETRVLNVPSNHYVIRLARLYGAPGTETNGKKSFVEIVTELARTQPILTMDTTEVACPTWVDDVARHLEQHIFSLPSPGIYHMTNEGGCTWYDWAKEIIKELELSTDVQPNHTPMDQSVVKKPAYVVLTSTKIPKMRPWQEALHEYLCTISR